MVEQGKVCDDVVLNKFDGWRDSVDLVIVLLNTLSSDTFLHKETLNNTGALGIETMVLGAVSTVL